MARIEESGGPRRQAIETAAVSGVTKEADRRLALAPVKAPRPSSVKGVGSGARAFAQLAKQGGQIINQYASKMAKEDYVQGEMLYQQGKTLQELEESGENANTVAGFVAMQATSDAHKWYTEELQSIDGDGKQMDPDAYRASLHDTFSAMLTGNEFTDGIITSLAADRMPKLAAAQMQSHTAWKENETYTSYVDMLVSRAESGDETVEEAMDLTDDNDLINGMSEDRRRQAMAEAISLTLEEDNTTLYDLIDPSMEGYSAALKSKVKKSFAAYEKRQQGKFNAALESDVRDVRMKVERGDMTYEEGVSAMQDLADNYGQDDKFMHAAETIMENAADRYSSKKAEDRFSPEERSDIRNLRLSMVKGDVSYEEGMEQAQALKYKYGKDDKWLTTVVNRLEGAADSFWNYQQQQLKAAEHKAIKQKEFADTVQGAVQSNNVWALDKKGQRAAWQILDKTLAVEAQEKIRSGELTPEQADEYVMNQRLATMSRWGVVDEATAQQWTSLFSYNVMDRDGKVSPQAVAALEQYRTFHDMNPLMASKYTLNQDAKDLIETALTLQEASMDPGDALAQAQVIMTRDVTPEQIRETLTSPELKVAIEQAVTSTVQQFDATMFSNMFGGEQSMFYEVWDDEIERAATSTAMRARIKTLAEAHLLRNPLLTPEVAVREAAKDAMANSTFIMGSMVSTTGATTMREDMGITASEPLVENAAVLGYLQAYGEKMWGQDFGDWTFFDDRGFSEVHLFSPGTWLNWEAEPLGNMKRAIRDIPEMSIQYDGSTQTFLVAPLSDDGAVGNLRRIPAKAIGTHYMMKRKEVHLKMAEPTPFGYGGFR